MSYSSVTRQGLSSPWVVLAWADLDISQLYLVVAEMNTWEEAVGRPHLVQCYIYQGKRFQITQVSFEVVKGLEELWFKRKILYDDDGDEEESLFFAFAIHFQQENSEKFIQAL